MTAATAATAAETGVRRVAATAAAMAEVRKAAVRKAAGDITAPHMDKVAEDRRLLPGKEAETDADAKKG